MTEQKTSDIPRYSKVFQGNGFRFGILDKDIHAEQYYFIHCTDLDVIIGKSQPALSDKDYIREGGRKDETECPFFCFKRHRAMASSLNKQYFKFNGVSKTYFRALAY